MGDVAEVGGCRADRARQVADLLRGEIVQGRFGGGRLPREAVLAREFGASRNTVREALRLLRDEGLVERCPGVGTTISGEKYPHGLYRLLGLAGDIARARRGDQPGPHDDAHGASGGGTAAPPP